MDTCSSTFLLTFKLVLLAFPLYIVSDKLYGDWSWEGRMTHWAKILTTKADSLSAPHDGRKGQTPENCPMTSPEAYTFIKFLIDHNDHFKITEEENMQKELLTWSGNRCW